MKKILFNALMFSALTATLYSCTEEEASKYSPAEKNESTDPVDIYLKEKFTKPYNSRVIWKWQGQLMGLGDYVTPPLRDVVIPASEMVFQYFVNPYNEVENGNKIIDKYFPAEWIYIGSPMYNSDGSITLGVAEGGVRITLTELDYFNASSRTFVERQMHTIHHEFTHILHQKDGIPKGYASVSPRYFGSQSLYKDDDEALQAGFVTPYSGTNSDEDFAELVSTYVTTSEVKFEDKYLTKEDCSSLTSASEIQTCIATNEGKDHIAKKVDLMKSFFDSKYGVDIDQLRDKVVKQLDENTQ